jgi:hypothetical protein
LSHPECSASAAGIQGPKEQKVRFWDNEPPPDDTAEIATVNEKDSIRSAPAEKAGGSVEWLSGALRIEFIAASGTTLPWFAIISGSSTMQKAAGAYSQGLITAEGPLFPAKVGCQRPYTSYFQVRSTAYKPSAEHLRRSAPSSRAFRSSRVAIINAGTRRREITGLAGGLGEFIYLRKWMSAQPFPQFPKIRLLSMRKPRRRKG